MQNINFSASHVNFRKPRAQSLLFCAALSAVLSGCGWVDATGINADSVAASLALNDAADGTVSVEEKKAVRVTASSTGSNGAVSSFRWSNAPVVEGALAQCDTAFAHIETDTATTLQNACVDANQCLLVFDEQPTAAGARAEFLATAPELRAPVGVTYDLTTTSNTGVVNTQSTTFCLQSKNNEPVAVDDEFTVVKGQGLNVVAGRVNLLTNDTDDVDNSNKPLRVISIPVVEPTYASEFELGTDGSFTYQFNAAAPSQVVSDSFVYELSDGVSTSMATVTLSIVEQNQAPEQTAAIPALYAIAGVPFQSDLSRFFSDVEGASLSYTVARNALPARGTLELSAAGVLSGTAAVLDEGTHLITLNVSDGSDAISAQVSLTVVENQAVEWTTPPIQSAITGERFTFNVASFFTDPEQQTLTYSLLDNLSDDIEMTINSSTGRLTGFFANAGYFALVIYANDGTSLASSLSLVVDVSANNIAPQPTALITDQSVSLGEAISPISADFIDANNDALSYALSGQGPAGLSIDEQGVLSGVPTKTGVFGGLRINATDSAGVTSVSNSFSITVLAASNAAPEYVDGSVFNQGITLGKQIRPVEAQFTDSDGDTLTYSVTGGRLPAGVGLNARTGVVSGEPSRKGWTRNLRIVATDSAGNSAQSDTFWIRVQ